MRNELKFLIALLFVLCIAGVAAYTSFSDGIDVTTTFTSGGLSNFTDALWISLTLDVKGVSTFHDSVVADKLFICTPDSRILSDDLIPANPGTLSLEPTGCGVSINCQDDDGCEITLNEGGGRAKGEILIITSVGTQAVTIIDTDGVSELISDANQVLNLLDSITLWYSLDTWVQIAPIADV